MEKAKLLDRLNQVEKLGRSRLSRFLHAPFKYIRGVAIHRLSFPFLKKGSPANTKTFWGANMQVILPAGLDIFLTGGKAHDSEIRLARWLIHQLDKGGTFLDVGAHYGYFSLLGWHVVGAAGRVVSVEASAGTFSILSGNIGQQGIEPFHRALSNENGNLSFYEFPVLYSEYNTLNAEMYADEHWYKHANVNKIDVTAIKGDDFLKEIKFTPGFIKIDVEGAEFEVVSGLEQFLTNNNTIVIMEFSNSNRGNKPHINAEKLLQSLGFQSHRILSDGNLCKLEEATDIYIDNTFPDSDNIVYKKL